MASGKSHQHGMYNGSKASPLLSQEYTVDLHVKMCKKIAQLTKVIYALNLKIDEYEVNMLSLKEAHQNEIDLISSETRGKLLQYEIMLEEEKNLRSQIQKLEETLEKNNRMKEQTLADLAMYKKETEERELKTQCEQSEKIAVLSKEMLSMKSDYESRLQHLIEEAAALRKEHETGERPGEKVNERLTKEIQALNNEIESLRTQNHKLTEEYTLKTNKMHSSYTKERENLRKALQQSVTEMIKQLQQKEQEQRKISQDKEATMQHEVNRLKGDIEAKECEIHELSEHSNTMKERIQELESQYRQADQELIESRSFQTQVAEELLVAKQRLLQQENEIQSQTEQMKTMSAAHKAAVKELTELKSQIDQLQQKPLNKISASKRDSRDTASSKQSTREHSVPKHDHMKQHKEDVSKSKRQKEAESKHLKEQLAKNREDLAKIHAAEIKSIQMSMEAEKRQLQKGYEMNLEELKKKYEYERNKLAEERDSLYCKLQDALCKNKTNLHHSEVSNPMKSCVEMKESVTQSMESRHKERCECVCPSSPIPPLDSLQGDSENASARQEESSHTHLKGVDTELDTCEKEMSRLEQENAALRDSVEMLSKEITLSQHEALGLKEKQSRNEEEMKLNQKMELDSLRQSHQHEIQSLVSKFSNSQTFLQTRIAALEAEVKDMEDKAKKQPRPEDLHLISCLQDKLTDKDQIIKHLLEIQNFDEVTMPISQETHRSQSFSCNPNAGSLTPTLKKKKIGEIPTRVISVPNLAVYEKTCPNHNMASKKPLNPVRNSPSLDHSVKPGYPFKPPVQLLDIIRPNRRNPSCVPSKTEAKDQDSKRPEWFTKYFSF